MYRKPALLHIIPVVIAGTILTVSGPVSGEEAPAKPIEKIHVQANYDTPGMKVPSVEYVIAPKISADEPLDGLSAKQLLIKAEWTYIAGHPCWGFRYLEAYNKLKPNTPEYGWRMARAHYMCAEELPETDEDGRMQHYAQMHTYVNACLERHPDYTDCLFYHAVALGRESTTRGMLASVSNAEEMHDTFLRVTKMEGHYHSVRGDTNVGSAFYGLGMMLRKVPDSWMLSKLAGVRGDKKKAVEMERQAVAIQPRRMEYVKELGMALVCLGEDQDNAAALAEGKAVLQSIVDGEYDNEWGMGRIFNDVDKRHAADILKDTSRACGYSRDGWEEIEL